MNTSMNMKLKIFVLAIMISGCGNDPSSTTSSFVLQQFDRQMARPTDTRALSESANPPLLRALESQVFDPEYNSDFQSAHISAWARENLLYFVAGSPYREIYSCQKVAADYAQGFSNSSGQGTFTVIGDLESDYTGSVEFIYDGCVMDGKAFFGSRKLTVFGEPESGYYDIGTPSDHFRWDYSDYYWGDGALAFYLDGRISYQKNPESHLFSYDAYTTTGDFVLAHKNSLTVESINMTTECSGVYSSGAFDAHFFGCDIKSGELLISGLGTYAVKSISPYKGSVWSAETKTEFSDTEDNKFIYWADGEKKRLTWVDATETENTYAVEYRSDNFDLVEGESLAINDTLAVQVLSSEFEHWQKKQYAYQTDEFILFKGSRASTVDAITSAGQQKRTIDLVDTAYDVHVNAAGDQLTSGHDGAVRDILLTDPNSTSQEYEIGLGKIVEVHAPKTVGVASPGQYTSYTSPFSFEWDHINERLSETRELDTGGDSFAYRAKNYLYGHHSSMFFFVDIKGNYANKTIQMGDAYAHLEFLDDNLLMTGAGALFECPTYCATSAAYWKSLNDEILARYPAAESQFFVSGAVDTKDNASSSRLMIFSTVDMSETSLTLHNREVPKYGKRLWAVDLNDTSRITELQLPINDFSSAGVRFDIHQLAKSKNGSLFVGSGSWALDSGRENTAFFSIDPAKISFN